MTSRFRKFIIFLVALSISSLACGVVTQRPTAIPTIEQPTSTPIPIVTDQNQEPVIDLQNYQDQLTYLYEQANPGVVSIRVLSEEGGGLGSGFVIDNEGHIITNYHVVRDAADLEIAFSSGHKTASSASHSGRGEKRSLGEHSRSTGERTCPDGAYRSRPRVPHPDSPVSPAST